MWIKKIAKTALMVCCFLLVVQSCKKDENIPDYGVLLVDGGKWVKTGTLEIKTDNDNLRFSIRLVFEYDDEFVFNADGSYLSQQRPDSINSGKWEIQGNSQLFLNKNTQSEEVFTIVGASLSQSKWEALYSNEKLGAKDIPVVITYESDYDPDEEL